MRMVKSGPLALLILGGCIANPSGPPSAPVELPVAPPVDVIADLCARANTDPISLAFCVEPRPKITSLKELQQRVGLGFVPGNTLNGDREQNGVLQAVGNPAFALTANSSSLVARFVSAVNPRAIIFTATNRLQNPIPGFVAMGFTRGEQFVELIAHDPVKKDLTFFLFRYELACDATLEGCTKADLLTPEVERGFTRWTLTQDVDLKNTVLDCLQCHQPRGPGTKKILRMQELQNPWTHWLRNKSAGPGDDPEGGLFLLGQYTAAHGNEDYAGIPGDAIANSDPRRLEGLLENNGFMDQPNEFSTKQIEAEVKQSNNLAPHVNVPAGMSATWKKLYADAVAGKAIPPPYHDVQVTDPGMLAKYTSAYRAVMAGDRAAAQALPEPTEMFLEAAVADLSFVPQKGLEGRGILIHMCQQCHNPNLDQTISRARFDVMNLDALSREEKDRAIARVKLPASSPLKMPPPRFRALSAGEIELVTQELLR